MTTWNATASKLLDSAETLIRTKGYNAFSFRDLQREVGVKTSTIHYYFATKPDLAAAVFERFFQEHRLGLDQLTMAVPRAYDRLEKVVHFFGHNAGLGRFCLGGMLSSDRESLDEATRGALVRFFAHFESWVSTTIAYGKSNGEFKDSLDPDQAARTFVALLEGGMLIHRVKGDSHYFSDLILPFIDQMALIPSKI
ncbi:MAG: TetR/AcrR family transcriptional regulator [Pseudobacteriovorax sp.]|nr:TetR/AcrR family transcriptional regulator [Pseudobacteriovorax sp.]